MSLKDNFNFIRKWGSSINRWTSIIIENKSTYIIICILFLALFGLLFIQNRYWNINSTIDDNAFSAFGDFCGGVLGTIFSVMNVLLLAQTFKYQRKVTSDNESTQKSMVKSGEDFQERLAEENRRQLDSQRFNDLFFELLHLYQSEVDHLKGKIIESKTKLNFGSFGLPVYKRDQECINFSNKDYFYYNAEKLRENFRIRNSLQENQNAALNYYALFYLENRSGLSAYYRTLYRIYDLIDNSTINENSKRNYLKIVRAQLTESELFFLRYNAMTYYGKKFVHYLNKYHVLKHLPAFDLLEFKFLWEKFSVKERMELNIMFDLLSSTIRKMVDKKQELYRSPDDRYSYTVKNKGFKIEITISIDKRKNLKNRDLDVLRLFSNSEISELLKYCIIEIFQNSNFLEYNVENISMKFPPVKVCKSVTSISGSIENTKHELLKLQYDFHPIKS